MPRPYENFLSMIDDFDTLVNQTLEQCNYIIETYTNIGSDMGEQISQACRDRIQTMQDEGSFTMKSGLADIFVSALAKSIIFGIGNGIGLSKARKKEEKAKKIIIDNCKILEQKFESISPTLMDNLNNQVSIHVEIVNNEYNKIQELIFSDKIANRNKGREIIKSHMTVFYKINFRKQQIKNLRVFFDELDVHLNDLENFSNWISKNILIDEKKYYEAVLSHYKQKIFDFSPKHDYEKNELDELWNEISSFVPNLDIDENDYSVNFDLNENSRNKTFRFQENKDQNGKCSSFSVL